MKKIYNIISGILLLFILTTSLNALSIGSLKDNPQRYNGRTVRLRGDVSFKAGIPFTDLQIYILQDNTGSIMVFSAFPKEKDQHASIKAEVVAYISEEQESDREESINRMTDYLIKNEILQRENARKAAEISLKMINSFSDSISGAWFVIEKEKRGFLNL